MAADDLNRLDPIGEARSTRVGDVPEGLRRRYYTEAGVGPTLGFYVDAQVRAPAFRDRGARLSTDRDDPNTVRDLVSIARHRGWSGVDVRGQSAFRRETWLAARAAGLEVRGYRPTARDLQSLERRERRSAGGREADHPPSGPRAPDPNASGPSSRLRLVEQVVRARVVDPDAQDRVLNAARARLAGWLERGATFEPFSREAPPRPRERRR